MDVIILLIPPLITLKLLEDPLANITFFFASSSYKPQGPTRPTIFPIIILEESLIDN